MHAMNVNPIGGYTRVMSSTLSDLLLLPFLTLTLLLRGTAHKTAPPLSSSFDASEFSFHRLSFQYPVYDI
jgi:hypothetical protein